MVWISFARLVAAASLMATVPTLAQPAPASFNPRATDLIDSDPALKQWAVRMFDSNHDGWLTLYEAQPAVAAFRELADGDHDGRVTVYEFGAAVAFISARYHAP